MKGLEKSALTVSAVAFFISDLIKNQLGSILIKGEISNLQKRPNSSYIRFSLKDSNAKLDCLTHSSSNAAKLLDHLKDGDEVLVFAQPSYYIKTGQMSFFTDEMMKLGTGIFYSNLEQLKQKLYEEGLFDQSKKKPLPQYPEKVGVVTSADGAVIQDIIRVATDRYPLVEIIVFPCLVQGKDAPQDLYRALSEALSQPLDAVIIGRGGGSNEDLEAFNDEKLVRLTANASIPIISAVGHEINMSLIDFASDYSAPTPTGAAMILFPDKNDILKELSLLRHKLVSYCQDIHRNETYSLDILKEQLHYQYEQYLQTKTHQLNLLHQQLENLNPNNMLKKGYSLLRKQNLPILWDNIENGDILDIITKDGILGVQVLNKSKHKD